MSTPQTMFEKIWARHVVAEGPEGPGGHVLLYVDRHLLHEGTTAAFGRLAKSGRRVRRPDLSVATADHYVLTSPGSPAPDAEVRGMVEALAAYGVRAVIAPSLGDIFHQNCFKNGLLPAILPGDVVAGLRRRLHAGPGATLTVDLEAQTVTAPDGVQHRFAVDAFRKEMLLTGRDEIGLTLGFETHIREFEARHAREMAWVMPRVST